MELISKGTRRMFREHLVSTSVLREIHGWFDDARIPQADLPSASVPAGQRRALIEQYYAGVDWESPTDVKKVLGVFEEILRQAAPTPYTPDPSEAFQRLNAALRRDGYLYEGTRDDGRLVSVSGIDISRVENATALVDRATLRDHVRRIEQSVDADPAQAIGSAKELVETAAKAVLEHYGDDPKAYDTFPRLVKAAIRRLDLGSEPMADADKGGKALAMLVGGMSHVAEATATLRNLYGTGHGRTRPSGTETRHAHLVVGACATLSSFLLETLDARKPT